MGRACEAGSSLDRGGRGHARNGRRACLAPDKAAAHLSRIRHTPAVMGQSVASGADHGLDTRLGADVVDATPCPDVARRIHSRHAPDLMTRACVLHGCTQTCSFRTA